MKFLQRYLVVLAALIIAVPMFGQGTTGNLNGTVIHEGNPLPGVTVTLSSPALQGTRVAVTNENGNYNFPALPPGDYTVRFEMEGMASATSTVRVGLASTARANADLKLTTVSEAITVTAAGPAVLETTEVQANYDTELIEDLPIGRTVQAIVNLAPGVSGGVGGAQISGAYSYDNLYLVNGAVTNENVRGQTDNLFIEDAIQETTVLTGAISAEYGRFTGGVVSAITKSGGNEFSGSFRDSFTNPQEWRSERDNTDDGDVDIRQEGKVNETYEATLGGRIIRDRLWFFLAGRYAELEFPGNFTGSSIPRPTTIQEDERYEIKLTGQITPKHSLVGSYLDYTVDQTPHCAFGCWELSTMDLDGRQLPREMVTAQYNGVLTSNFLVEAGYSMRTLTFENSGGNSRDRIFGTWGYDFASGLGGAWGAPIFCGVCDPEERNNEYYNIKGTYYLATGSLGTHNLVAGYENFAEERLANNYQSGSDFDIYIYNEPGERDAAGNFFPVITGRDDSEFGLGDVLQWVPILELSRGSDWVTDSIFVNDKWDINNRLQVNIGARYDRNEGKDSAGNLIADDSYVSPRLGLIFDIFGNGRLRANASYSQYVSRIQETVGGGASGAGNPAYIKYEYTGPTIRGLSSFDAIRKLFEWFDAQGGVGGTPIYGAGIPGVNSGFRESLDSPHVDEFTIGIGGQIGSRGFLRADYVDREWADMYATRTAPNDQVDTFVTVPGVSEPFHVEADFIEYFNDDDNLVREYRGVMVQGSYRLMDRLNIGANYTWSENEGNTVGETTGGGPGADTSQQYREYKAFSRNNPVGFLPFDQEHKGRLWITYDQPLGRFGNVGLSLLERWDSGTPFSAVSAVGIAGRISNPGYLTPPSTATYYFSDRGEFRWDDLTATDISVNYELPISRVNIFIQGELFNAFNEQAQIAGNTSITTFTSGGRATFNPFTGETPTECPQGTATATCLAAGHDWRKGTFFGKSTALTHLQAPRTWQFSAGIRF